MLGLGLRPASIALSIAQRATSAAAVAGKIAQLNVFDTTGGQAAANLPAWNDINTGPAKSPTLIALKDPSGVATGWSATWTTAPMYGNNFGTTPLTGVPDAVAASGVYTQTADVPGYTMRVSGLVAGRSYKVQTYNSRSGSGTPTRNVNVAAGGGSATVNAFGNNALITIAAAVADTSGNLDIAITSGTSSVYAHLNLIIITEIVPAGASTSPATGTPSSATYLAGDDGSRLTGADGAYMTGTT